MYVVRAQVILVGHSCGGASISYALEHYPTKISKAIFLCATMVSDGQRPFDVFAEQVGSLFVSFNQVSLHQMLSYIQIQGTTVNQTPENREKILKNRSIP